MLRDWLSSERDAVPMAQITYKPRLLLKMLIWILWVKPNYVALTTFHCEHYDLHCCLVTTLVFCIIQYVPRVCRVKQISSLFNCRRLALRRIRRNRRWETVARRNE